jgi:hypothetical protein
LQHKLKRIAQIINNLFSLKCKKQHQSNAFKVNKFFL